MTEKQHKKIHIVANWKMNPLRAEDAKRIGTEIKKSISRYKHVQVVICPSFVHIPLIAKIGMKNNLALGAQNSAWSEKESLTGEVSVSQLKDSGVSYVIVGHSERRAHGETGVLVSQKIQTILKQGLTPILCIGESSRDENGQYLAAIQTQLTQSLEGIPKKIVEHIWIAYEPLWAIGAQAKRSAHPEEVEEVSIAIRRTISDMYSFSKIPKNIILYGGSVSNKKEIAGLLQKNIDGFLIGRASLSAKTLLPLIEEANA